MNLNEQAILEKNNLLKNSKSAILSTINSDKTPNASYAPISTDDNNNFYFYISELSKHTNNLLSNKNISLMLIQDECKSENIFARKRLTINGTAKLIDRKNDDWKNKMRFMELRFKDEIKFLKDMKDFHLFQIKPINGLLVFGFGKAFKFTNSQLSILSHANEKGHKINS